MKDEDILNQPPKYAELLESYNQWMIKKKQPAESTRKNYVIR